MLAAKHAIEQRRGARGEVSGAQGGGGCVLAEQRVVHGGRDMRAVCAVLTEDGGGRHVVPWVTACGTLHMVHAFALGGRVIGAAYPGTRVRRRPGGSCM